jgi:hypothetical protein
MKNVYDFFERLFEAVHGIALWIDNKIEEFFDDDDDPPVDLAPAVPWKMA